MMCLTATYAPFTALFLSFRRAQQVDCYSYALVLWALLSWDVPFRGMDQMQILVAVAYHHKRPTTKALESLWPPEVLKVMRALWHANPELRPSMEDARNVLHDFVEDKTSSKKS